MAADTELKAKTAPQREALELASAKLVTQITDPLAQQAAAMMVEDMRTYVQAVEQVSLAASAKALTGGLKDPETAEASLKLIAGFQQESMVFSRSILDLAVMVRSHFADPA